MIKNSQNTFWETTRVYGFGTVFVRGISFLLVFFYTNLLTPFDAGVVYLIYTIIAFLSPLYAYGMGSSLFKFYNNDNYNKTEVLASSFVSVFISSAVFSSLIILFAQYLNVLIVEGGINWFYYIAGILFFDAVSARALAILRVLERPFIFLFVNLLNVVSSIVFNLWFIYYSNLASVGAVFALFSVSALQMFCVLFFFIKKIHISSFRFNVFKKMLLFGWPFLPAALLLVVIGFSDRWFIKFYLGLDAVGIYSPAYKIGSVLGLIVTAFNYNWQNYSLKKNHDISNDFGKISSVFIVFLVVVFVSLVVGVEPLLQIKVFGSYLFGESFWPGLPIIPFIALGYLFYGVYVLHSPAIYLYNKQRWNLFFWFLGAFINVVGNIFLIPRFGLLGASYATAFAYFIMAVLLIYKSSEWLKINFSFYNLFCSLCSAFLVLFINCWFGGLGVFSLLVLLAVFVAYNLFLIFKIQKPDTV